MPKKSHLLRKYYCTIDLLFDWFGFSGFVVLKLSTDLLVWPNPNTSPYEVSECCIVTLMMGGCCKEISEQILHWANFITF